MTHLEDGRLRAYIDGELGPDGKAEIDRWIEEDETVRLRLEAMRERDRRIPALLAVLDVPPPTERVRRAIGEARGTSRPSRRPGTRIRWAQAAALVLFLAAAASALPTSPVRMWLSERVAGEAAQEAPADAATAVATPLTGTRIAPASDHVDIELTGLPPGSDIIVTLVASADAGLFVPVEGSSLETFAARGRIRAALTAGPVRVELPTDVASATLTVDGRIYLSKDGSQLDLPGPVEERSQGRVHFRTVR